MAKQPSMEQLQQLTEDLFVTSIKAENPAIKAQADKCHLAAQVLCREMYEYRRLTG